MTVYLIADVKVTDDGWVPAYAASVHELVHKHGGKFLSRRFRKAGGTLRRRSGYGEPRLDWGSLFSGRAYLASENCAQLKRADARASSAAMSTSSGRQGLGT